MINHDYLTTKKTMTRFYHQQSSSSVEGYQEEAAFAEDAIRGARLGGSIWPPRSYSCSFCKREFRSAQALGGHMNVHRKDRALLKQVITSHHDHDHDHDHDHHRLNHSDRDHHDCVSAVSPSSKSLLPQNPSQVCGPRTSRVSRVSTNSVISGVRKVISSNNEVVQANISMGLDLAIRTSQEEECFNYANKRFKKSGDDNVALFEEIKCSIKDNADLRVPEIVSLEDSISMEELDLELRLGKPPQKLK